MAKRVVIVGAVALGPKVAARVMRLDPSAEVKLLDKDYIISYGGCGIPYYIGGDVADLEGLRSTSAHVLRDSQFFKNAKCVDVLHAEALAIDRRSKTLKIRHQTDGKEENLPYDKLVLATGAAPVQPPLPGVDLPGVSVVANLHHAKVIKDMIAKGQVESAVVIGGGAIGLEMAEALTDLWGVETTLVEMMDQLLPPAFGPDMALLIKNHMTEKGVRVLLSERVTRILGDKQKGVQAVETSNGQIPCQLVILAVGVRPNSTLAREAGLAVGRFGGIRVDEGLRTSDPDIYAGGDCVEILHKVSGETVHMPLGSLANRQGRVIGTNITGGRGHFGSTVGTFCLKVFDFGIARAGLTERQAAAAGFDPVHAVVVQSDRAHFYPSQELMYVKLIADRKTRRVLGIEAVGKAGDAVKGRVDAVAALLHHDVCLEEISNLEVAYAPPFASAMDIVNNAANALENILEGRQEPIDVAEFLEDFKEGKVRVLDVRSAVQSSPFMEKYGSQWLNIPQEELICRLDEVPRGEKLCLICGSGPRSYEAQLLLRSKGIEETKNIQGGVGMVKFSDPDFAPSE
ncbi:MAG: FAD-dependent oxidoreductase [Desulfobacterales bacterium]|nr:FAD-dependent oxidoreductase [Desulfobacterales bacterium]